MPLKSYGVLVGRAVDRRREGGTDTPHYQVRLDGGGTSYRIAVNVQSQESPSELLYLVDDDFRHPVTAAVGGLGSAGTRCRSQPGGPSLDFIRGNLFDRAAMRLLPADVAGPDNDLADVLDHYVQRAIGDPAARVYAFGERWGPETGVKDKVFGFQPGNGVHDIHMNQGNGARFRGDDGVWQDGGLLIHLGDRWIGIFLAFQSQAWHTDDVTGHAIAGARRQPTRPAPDRTVRDPDPRRDGQPGRRLPGGRVRVPAQRVAEARRPHRLAPRRPVKQTCPLPAGPLEAGAVLKVRLASNVQLGNKGGSITLLDRDGLKAAGVAYTAEQAKKEGWSITF